MMQPTHHTHPYRNLLPAICRSQELPSIGRLYKGMTLSKDQRQIYRDLTGVYKEKAVVTQNFHADD